MPCTVFVSADLSWCQRCRSTPSYTGKRKDKDKYKDKDKDKGKKWVPTLQEYSLI